MRISDADRERVIDVLKTATGEGRLTLDEFSERAGAIYEARTGAELEQVMVDLPQPYRPPAPAQASEAGLPREREPARWTIGIMGGGKRRGRYRLRTTTNAIAFWGGCDLDLRHAEVEGPEIVINAVAIMGGVEIIVPEGIAVELSGIAIMGSKDLRGKDVPTLPGSPLVRVRAFALMGGVNVKAKPIDPQTRSRRRRSRTELDPEARPEAALGWGVLGGPSSPAHESGGADPLASRAVDDPDDPVAAIEGGLIDAGAHGHLPLQKLRALPEGTITVAFVDLHGPSDAAERADVVESEVSAAGGHLIAVKGQEVMMAFTGAAPALRCAIGIEEAFAKRNSEHPDGPVQVRVGLHAGEMSRAADDFFAGSVMVAAAVTKEAKDGQILVSSVLKELCSLSGEFDFGPGEDMALEGLSTPRRVYPVAWTGRP